MRTRAICLLAAAASALGVLSPFITGLAVDSDFKGIPFVYSWFYWLPGLVTYWIEPESDSAFMAVSMVVYAVQYLALFGVIWGSTRAAVRGAALHQPASSSRRVGAPAHSGFG